MQVRYNPKYAMFLIVLALINFGLAGILTLMRGSFQFGMVLGLMLAVLGYLMLQRPYFTIDPQQVMIPAMIGPIKRTFEFASPTDIKIEKNALFVNRNGNWRNIGVRRWLAHKDDWYNLEAYVQRMNSGV